MNDLSKGFAFETAAFAAGWVSGLEQINNVLEFILLISAILSSLYGFYKFLKAKINDDKTDRNNSNSSLPDIGSNGTNEKTIKEKSR